MQGQISLNRIIMLFLFSIAVSLITSISVFYYLAALPPEEPASPQLLVTKKSQTTPVQQNLTSNDNSSWKTVILNKYNFSYKYPSSYFVTGVNEGNTFFSENEDQRQKLNNCLANPKNLECNNYALRIEVSIKSKPTSQTLREFLKNEIAPSPFVEITIDGFKAMQNQFNGIGTVNNIYIDKGSSVLHIFANSITNSTTNMAIYKSIISTFKFTK